MPKPSVFKLPISIEAIEVCNGPNVMSLSQLDLVVLAKIQLLMGVFEVSDAVREYVVCFGRHTVTSVKATADPNASVAGFAAVTCTGTRPL